MKKLLFSALTLIVIVGLLSVSNNYAQSKEVVKKICSTKKGHGDCERQLCRCKESHEKCTQKYDICLSKLVNTNPTK